MCVDSKWINQTTMQYDFSILTLQDWLESA